MKQSKSESQDHAWVWLSHPRLYSPNPRLAPSPSYQELSCGGSGVCPECCSPSLVLALHKWCAAKQLWEEKQAMRCEGWH